MWQEDTRKKSAVNDSEMVDLSFSVDCKELPYDHAYELSSEIIKLIPEIKNDKRNAIQTLHGPMSGNGWVRADGENIFLSKRAKLCLRVSKDHVEKIKEIEGKKIKLFGNDLNIGKSKMKSFLVVRDLFCRFVSCNEDLPEDSFLEEVQTELRAYKVNINKALCGQSKRISFGDKTLYTRSLMIADLSKEEAVTLQEEGVGKHRLFGCGIFLPHKSIDAVSNFKEDD
jgi:CRISPR-associated protein Cas6